MMISKFNSPLLAIGVSAMLSRLDRNVGKVLDVLDELRLADIEKELTMKLAADLERWREEVNVQRMTPNPNFTGFGNNQPVGM